MPDKNAYLKEMGIDVWLERNIETVYAEATAEVPSVPVVDTATVDIQVLDWQALQTQISKCQLCELAKTRLEIGLGVGEQTADLMIIANDTSEQSAKLLTAMLKAMGSQRKEVYISDVVKCRLKENQEAIEDQAIACEPYLLREINLVQPKLILVLGNAAAQYFLKTKSTMNRLRGQSHHIDGINAPILVSYHPAYLLAAPSEKHKAWQDLQLVMNELKV